MKLNHLNLTVTDVPATFAFFEKYFGLRGFGTLPPSEQMAFMADDNGMVLALMRPAGGGPVKYPPGFHVGFVQASAERVNEINQQLRHDGYQVPNPARIHGSWTFYFQSPGGFTVEVLA